MATDKRDTILIIDDSKLNVMALSRILSQQYSVFFEDSGEKGIRAAKLYKPDLILLDIIMPHMTGYKVIKILKADPETCNIPVIFLTGRGDVQDIELGFILGAVDYINKPFSPAVVMLRIRTQLKIVHQMRAIENLSREDALTRLGNRRQFNYILNQVWAVSKRQRLPLSLMIINIDRFKNYNDTYGHLSGDMVIKGIAEIISSCVLRATDHVARWGGEEFAVILPGTDLDGALLVSEKIRSGVENAVFELTGGAATNVTVSIGVHSVVVSTDDTYTPKHFISDTDAALYEAKKQGRNRIVAVEG